MAINECTPQRIFGGFDQHLFLGLSVIDFTATLGWNEQPTQVTIRLVKDECACVGDNVKKYFDPSSTPITKNWTAADPGFYIYGPNGNEAPEIGSAVYFRVENFEFCGILQSYRRLDSQQGKDIYEVILTSPQSILEGCQVILDDYSGGVGNTYNLFNVFGFHESFGMYCPPFIQNDDDGVIFGSEAYGFGGAEVNENGMLWTKIKSGLSSLASSVPPAQLIGYSIFSPYGRIVFKGSNTSSHKFGLFPYNQIDVRIPGIFGAGASQYISHYFLDLSDMPVMPDDYRISGTTISVLDLISTVCNDAGSDYFIELIPVKSGSVVHKFIKVRSILRKSQPNLTAVSQFVNSIDNYVGRYAGAELRNDFNNKVILGGNKQIIYQCERNEDPDNDLHESCLSQAILNNYDHADNTIAPYWGTHSNGDVILTNSDINDFWEFEADTSAINISLNLLALSSTVTINEVELLYAREGFDGWQLWSAAARTDIAVDTNMPEITIIQNELILNPNLPRDQKKVAKGVYVGDPELLRDLSKIHQWVLNFAENYYGRLYMVRLPNTCVSIVDNKVSVSESPSDAGWTEDEEIIQLPNPHVLSDFFRNDDDTIRPFVRFDVAATGETYEWSGNRVVTRMRIDRMLNERYVYATGSDGSGNIWVDVEVWPDIYFADVSSLCSPRAIIELDEPVYLTFNENRFKHFKGIIDVNAQQSEEDARKQIHLVTSGIIPEPLKYGLDDIPQIPDAAAVPMYSHINKYGPWFTNNSVSVGPPGNTLVEVDDNLVPWVYGSQTLMSAAGQNLANAGTSNMREGETGDITVAGYPTLPLGAELGVLNGIGGTTPSYFANNEHLAENRSTSRESHKFVSANLFPANKAVLNSGIWDAKTNAPLLTSSVGTENSYFVVSRAGTTSLDDVNEWEAGDVAVFYSGEWQKAPADNVVNEYVKSNSWTGVYGPNITNISIAVGEQGLTTTYSLRTHTAVFGRFGKLNADRLERLSSARKSKDKEARIDNYLNSLIRQRLRQKAQRLRTNEKGSAQEDRGTPHEVLVGGIFNVASGTQFYQRSIVADKALVDVNTDLMTDEFSNRSFMSWDGLVRPISVDGDGSLPQYYQSDATGGGKTSSQGSQPPVTDVGGGSTIYNLDIDIDYLNPVSNPWELNRSTLSDRHDGDAGHDIDVIGRGTRDTIENIIMPVAGQEDEKRADYFNDYRLFALKGPMLLQSWGYDLDGKPVPNAADIESSALTGGFTDANLQDKFLLDFIHKSHTWPVAPVDLRLDRKRGVWVSPPSYRLVMATLYENLETDGSGNAYITDGPQLYDGAGNVADYGGGSTTAPTILVYDKVGNALSSGDSVLAYYDPQKEKYYVVECTASGGEISAGNYDCGQGAEYASTDLVSQLLFGTGIKFTQSDVTGEVNLDLTFGNSSVGGCDLAESNSFIGDQINFGKGLKFTSAGCVGTASLAAYVENTDNCPDEWNATTTGVAHSFEFGKGIGLNFANDGTCGTGLITLALDVLDGSPSYYDSYIDNTFIMVGTGISASYTVIDDCTGVILTAPTSDVGGSGIVVNNEDCSGNIQEGAAVTDVTAGPGLEFDWNPLTYEATLYLDLDFNNSSVSICNTGADYEKVTTAIDDIERFNFGEGLTLLYPTGDPCTLDVVLALPISGNDNCYNQSSDPGGTQEVKALGVGKGIKYNYSLDECGASFHLAMDVSDPDSTVSNVAELSFSTDFNVVADGDCGALVSYTGTPSGVITVEDSDLTFCTGDDTITNADKILFGQGLGVYDLGNKDALVTLGIPLTDNDECHDFAYPWTTNNTANTLIFGKGLGITEYVECQPRIGLSLDVDSQSSTSSLVSGVGNLVFGEGFDVAEEGTCGVLIDFTGNSLIVEDSDQNVCTGDDTIVGADKILFGKGLSVYDLGSSDALVGLGMLVTDDDTCYDDGYAWTDDKTANEVTFGKGLGVMEVAAEDCHPRISLAMNFGGQTNVGEVTFGQNFLITSANTCGAHVEYTGAPSGSLTVQDSAWAFCTGDATVEHVHSILIGKGLAIQEKGSHNAVITLGTEIYSTDDCYDSDVAWTNGNKANAFRFGKGLGVMQYATCAPEIGLAFDVYQKSNHLAGIAELAFGDSFTVEESGECGVLVEFTGSISDITVIDDDECCGGSDWTTGTTEEIRFGKGLCVSEYAANIPRVSLGIDITAPGGTENDIAEIEFGTNFKLTSQGDCGVLVELTGAGEGGSVSYMTGVYCGEDGDIYGEFGLMNFDAQGHFIGITYQ